MESKRLDVFTRYKRDLTMYQNPPTWIVCLLSRAYVALF